MAMVPQKVIRRTAFAMDDPPVFAAKAPKKIKKKRVHPYKLYSMFFNGKNRVTAKGKRPPTVNEAPEAKAACMGLA